MSAPADGLEEIREKYEARAGLDPLRAVLDAGDPDNRKNAFVDLLERRVLARAVGPGPHPVALDLGCGVGRFFGLLAPRCGRILGLDATGALLRAAGPAAAASGAARVQGAAGAIPMRDGSASLVLSCGVLIHCPEGALDGVAREVRRVLRPGGRFVALEHMAPGPASEAREGILYRSPAEFRRPFLEAGLSLRSEAAVRKVPSRVVHWVRTGRLPRALWGLGAFLEPRLALRGREPPSYRDHLFVWERPDGAG